MNDGMKLLGLLFDAPDPSLPDKPLHEELRIAADQLATDITTGRFGMLLSEAERGRLIALNFALLRWAERALALHELARPQTRRERPRRWWHRITWRRA